VYPTVAFADLTAAPAVVRLAEERDAAAISVGTAW
jgi:hypothetical protein